MNEDAERRILKILDGFIESKVLMTAFELDLFTAAREPIARADLMAALGLPERSGTILIDACRALDLLEEEGGRVRTRPELASFLLRGADQPFRVTTYLIEYYAEVYRALADMRELVLTDGASSTFGLRDYFKDDVAAIDPKIAAEYSRYMDATISGIVDVVLASVPLEGREYLFDLCGGTGAFCTAIARRLPHLRVGFLDVPACVAIGAARLEADPALAARVTAVSGNVFDAPLPRDADVVTVSRAAMDWGDERVLYLYRKVHDALPDHGIFLVIERMLPEEPTPEAKPSYLRSIYFLAKSTSTRLRTPRQHVALLQAAGFAEAELVVPPRDPHRYLQGFRVVLARKRKTG